MAAGTITTGVARADTVITGEGVFQPRGSTAQQFGGVFCQPSCVTVSSMPTSVRSQALKLDAAVMSSTGPTTVWGFSLSAVAVHQLVDEWTANPDTAPDPERVRIITTGNPVNKFGGTQRDRSSAVAMPAEQPYSHLDVVAQYDSVADRPARWGWYSAIEVSLSRHMSYDEADINDPANLVYRDGNTTHMLIPAQELRQLRGLRWLRDIGWVTPERYDEVDAERRARIEADFDRPAFIEQGEGADWANGIEPDVLRDSEAEEETWDQSLSAEEAEEESGETSQGGGESMQSGQRSTSTADKKPSTSSAASSDTESGDETSTTRRSVKPSTPSDTEPSESDSSTGSGSESAE